MVRTMSFQRGALRSSKLSDVLERAADLGAEIAHVQGLAVRIDEAVPEISSTRSFPKSMRMPRENELGRS